MIGVYAFIPKRKLFPYYIGYSKNVKKRIREHQANDRPFADMNSRVMYQAFECVKEAYRCEQSLIATYNPLYNKIGGRDVPRHFIHECESIDEVFAGYENPPWKRLSMVDSVFYHKDRQEWIEKGRPRDDR